MSEQIEVLSNRDKVRERINVFHEIGRAHV